MSWIVIGLAWLAAPIVVLSLAFVAWPWILDRRRGPVTGEVCRECFVLLRAGAAWRTIEHYPASEADAMFGGGTYGEAWWCRRHRRPGAERHDPR